MKITFQTTAGQSVNQQAEKANFRETGKQRAAERFPYLEKTDRTWGGRNNGCHAARDVFTSNKKTLIELQQDAQVQDVTVQRDYMTIMSHTMSQEDYAKMEEEGFHFEQLHPEEAVTIVDKIKAELARSGQLIAGYTDNLDMETLAAAVGSDALAQAISKSFYEADIPLTSENMNSVVQAWNMASGLSPLEEGTQRYLVDNEMEPEIWNTYLAQSSGAESKTAGAARYYAEEIPGYYAQGAGQGAKITAAKEHSEETAAVSGKEARSDAEKLQEQVDSIIEKAGFPVNEESREMAKWLMDKGLPLTEENLQRMETLQGISLPPSEESFAQMAANAIAKGKAPIHANLAEEENIYEKAAKIAAYYAETDFDFAEENITARRQLEEIRLRMTAEVNVKLLKSGFSIDTAPMERLVEALKEAEAKLAGEYFPNDEQALLKYRNYRDTGSVLEELPALPAGMLGAYSAEETLQQFHTRGRELQASYEKANASYEALMTAPRKDLGDHIRKAFANVDAILEDLELELSDENRRAVRILGYNRMEVTPENVELVREADERVQFVIEKMTPAATLRMIRDGVNPLEKTLPELEQYFDALPEEYKDSAESYSKFLYGLEKSGKVTEEERDTYIGIYRLIRQIEKADGAAVGALINSQAQLHLGNLLSAVRTGKFKHLDAKVSDSFGAVVERIRQGENITEQISKAFVRQGKEILTDISYSEESTAAYSKEALSHIRQAVTSEEDCMALLQKGETTANAENLLTAQALLQENSLFSQRRRDKLQNMINMSETEKPHVSELLNDMEQLASSWEDLDTPDIFEENYQSTLEKVSDTLEQATWEAANELDVRELKMMHGQLSLAGKLASSQEYFLSMDIDGELAGVHLTVETGREETGLVRVSWRMQDADAREAEFTLHENKITAVLQGNGQTEVTDLQKIADTFTEQAKQHWTVEEIAIAGARDKRNADKVNTARQIQGTDVASVMKETEKVRNEPESTRPRNAQLYQIAKIFIQAVRQQERGNL